MDQQHQDHRKQKEPHFQFCSERIMSQPCIHAAPCHRQRNQNSDNNRTAFDAGMGRRRMQLATGLMAAYLGYAALSGSGYLILYFGCAVWALTDLCSLTPKPKQENAA